MKILLIFFIPFICFCQNKPQTDSVPVYPKREKLDEVVIKPLVKTMEIGFHNAKKTLFPRWVHLSPVHFVGIHIKNPKPNKKSFVKELMVETRGTTGQQSIRAHLYIVEPVSKTIHEIPFENAIIHVEKGSHLIRVNIESEKILFPPEGLIFALEFIGNGINPISVRAGKVENRVKHYLIIPNNLSLKLFKPFASDENYAMMLGISISR